MSFNFENTLFKVLLDWAYHVQDRNDIQFIPPLRDGQDFPIPVNSQLSLNGDIRSDGDNNAIISIIQDVKFTTAPCSTLTFCEEDDIIQQTYYTGRRVTVSVATQGRRAYDLSLALSSSLDNAEVVQECFLSRGFGELNATPIIRSLRDINEEFQPLCVFNITLTYTLSDSSLIPVLKDKPCIDEIITI